MDWHRGALSSRRLTVLVKHLPRDSAVNRDLHGEATDWGPAEHLLAAAVDHLAVANWMTGTLHSDEDTEPLEYPEPVPRPGMRVHEEIETEEPRVSELGASQDQAIAQFFN
ncbi:hypothetical protein [Streptomyces sp. I05A-00742]|uniref:hypothetical protein n=1 Tax=Streptomyces sp. I05A-00742 TaxID=2732853 RepID=UPI0014880DCB|nr:hypothetical protein [Streptomyces sp. I05A-00742]